MGGVMIRDYHIWPELFPFLGIGDKTFADLDPRLREALIRHSAGKLEEDDFWKFYTEVTGKTIPPHEGPLLGKFFHPKMDEPTLCVVGELKSSGMRVVCGTNVIDSHYKIHTELGQYSVFDKVYASHLIGAAKPDIAFYSHILNEEGLRADEVFFTDDSPVNTDAASSIGIKAFDYSDAQNLRAQICSLQLLSKN